MSGPQPRSIVRIGVFEVNLASGELRKGGVKIKVQDLPFRFLVVLLERPGEVVIPGYLAPARTLSSRSRMKASSGNSSTYLPIDLPASLYIVRLMYLRISVLRSRGL